jgi:hypothetical protein
MKATLVVVTMIVGCAGAPALITSKLYWGYWIAPPSANVVASLASLERFTTFHCCTPNDSRSGHRALHDSAQTEFHGAGDWPVANLPATLVQRNLEPDSEDAVPAAMMTRIRETLESRGMLRAGQPGYTHAKELWGHIAIGRDARGAQIVVAALWGGEVSNDHHPYYEVAFRSAPTGALQLFEHHQYWFDVAGLEGIAQWLAAFGGLAVGTALSAAYLFRRNRRAA